MLLAARVCRPRAALVFVPLVSLTETLVEDRALFPAGGVRARLVAALDRAAFRAADLVLADTDAHAAYFRALGAPADRVATWHFGVEPEFVAAAAGAAVAAARALLRALPAAARHRHDPRGRGAARRSRRRRARRRRSRAAAHGGAGGAARGARHVARRGAARGPAGRAGRGGGGAGRLRRWPEGGAWWCRTRSTRRPPRDAPW